MMASTLKAGTKLYRGYRTQKGQLSSANRTHTWFAFDADSVFYYWIQCKFGGDSVSVYNTYSKKAVDEAWFSDDECKLDEFVVGCDIKSVTVTPENALTFKNADLVVDVNNPKRRMSHIIPDSEFVDSLAVDAVEFKDFAYGWHHEVAIRNDAAKKCLINAKSKSIDIDALLAMSIRFQKRVDPYYPEYEKIYRDWATAAGKKTQWEKRVAAAIMATTTQPQPQPPPLKPQQLQAPYNESLYAERETAFFTFSQLPKEPSQNVKDPRQMIFFRLKTTGGGACLFHAISQALGKRSTEKEANRPRYRAVLAAKAPEGFMRDEVAKEWISNESLPFICSELGVNVVLIQNAIDSSGGQGVIAVNSAYITKKSNVGVIVYNVRESHFETVGVSVDGQFERVTTRFNASNAIFQGLAEQAPRIYDTDEAVDQDAELRIPVCEGQKCKLRKMSTFSKAELQAWLKKNANTPAYAKFTEAVRRRLLTMV